MKLWRIGSAGPSWTPTDLSGTGSAISPGRWNTNGNHAVYVAPTVAMAILETAAHVRMPALPLNRYLVEIDVPDDVWARRQVTLDGQLKVGWDAVPHGMISTSYGDSWLLRIGEALNELPSSIAPEESIVLINPKHPDANRITAKAIRRVHYSLLFR